MRQEAYGCTQAPVSCPQLTSQVKLTVSAPEKSEEALSRARRRLSTRVFSSFHIISCNWSCVIFWFCVNAEVFFYIFFCLPSFIFLHTARDEGRWEWWEKKVAAAAATTCGTFSGFLLAPAGTLPGPSLTWSSTLSYLLAALCQQIKNSSFSHVSRLSKLALQGVESGNCVCSVLGTVAPLSVVLLLDTTGSGCGTGEPPWAHRAELGIYAGAQ